MLKMTLAVLAVIAVIAACNDPGKDWSTIALDDTIQGSVNNASFEIRIPKGWKRDVDLESMKGWRPDVEEFHTEPSVTVGYVQQPPESLDAYIKRMVFQDTPIVDKKMLNADYLIVASHTAEYGLVRVDLVTHRGDTYLGCNAFQMRRGGVPNPQRTMEWLETICRSLVIK